MIVGELRATDEWSGVSEEAIRAEALKQMASRRNKARCNPMYTFMERHIDERTERRRKRARVDREEEEDGGGGGGYCSEETVVPERARRATPAAAFADAGDSGDEEEDYDGAVRSDGCWRAINVNFLHAFESERARRKGHAEASVVVHLVRRVGRLRELRPARRAREGADGAPARRFWGGSRRIAADAGPSGPAARRGAGSPTAEGTHPRRRRKSTQPRRIVIGEGAAGDEGGEEEDVSSSGDEGATGTEGLIVPRPEAELSAELAREQRTVRTDLEDWLERSVTGVIDGAEAGGDEMAAAPHHLVEQHSIPVCDGLREEAPAPSTDKRKGKARADRAGPSPRSRA